VACWVMGGHFHCAGKCGIDPNQLMGAFMKKLIVVGSVTLGLLSGCATAPENIGARYVSPAQYSSYDCDQIQQELQRVEGRVSQVSGQQQKKASSDQIAMGVGIVLFWPALFFLAGNDQKEELSSLKGTYDALAQAAIQKKCTINNSIR